MHDSWIGEVGEVTFILSLLLSIYGFLRCFPVRFSFARNNLSFYFAVSSLRKEPSFESILFNEVEDGC